MFMHWSGSFKNGVWGSSWEKRYKLGPSVLSKMYVNHYNALFMKVTRANLETLSVTFCSPLRPFSLVDTYFTWICFTIWPLCTSTDTSHLTLFQPLHKKTFWRWYCSLLLSKRKVNYVTQNNFSGYSKACAGKLTLPDYPRVRVRVNIMKE